MPSERERRNQLQDQLKESYGINKNITQPLSAQECQKLLDTLKNDASVLKLVESYASKNEELSRNNRRFGRERSRAEEKLISFQTEKAALAQELTTAKASLERAQTQVKPADAEFEQLQVQLQQVLQEQQELKEANSILQRENRNLTNLVNQIQLRLAKDFRSLLQYEDSELRRAAIRLFRWTLE